MEGRIAEVSACNRCGGSEWASQKAYFSPYKESGFHRLEVEEAARVQAGQWQTREWLRQSGSILKEAIERAQVDSFSAAIYLPDDAVVSPGGVYISSAAPDLIGELKQAQRIYKAYCLPPGYRFFPDEDREAAARFIDWAMNVRNDEAFFITLTFRNFISLTRANATCGRWIARENQSFVDSSGGYRLRWIRAIEWQKRQVVHYHLVGLGCGLHSMSRKRIEARWNSLGGGFCRVYEADYHLAPYLAKYMNKRLGGELEWYGSWQGLVVPTSVGCPGFSGVAKFGVGQRP